MFSDSFLRRFADLVQSPDEGTLAPAALLFARVEYPRLDPDAYVQQLDAMGAQAAARLARVPVRTGPDTRVAVLNEYLYEKEGFAGNREHYEDPRNSLLNQVIERRTGIPISLALVYMEVARRAGLRVEGVNFPGHFLLRCPREERLGREVIIDPFHRGAILSERDCRQLLRQHVGDEAAFDRGLLARATKHQIIVRMMVNLKRSYVHMRSFPQARAICDLLLAVDPSGFTELRDRGLLSYHLQDFASALRDLEMYLRLLPRTAPGQAPPGPAPDSAEEAAAEVAAMVAEEEDGETPADEARQEYEQIWEHVKQLRRRVASFN